MQQQQQRNPFPSLNLNPIGGVCTNTDIIVTNPQPPLQQSIPHHAQRHDPNKIPNISIPRIGVQTEQDDGAEEVARKLKDFVSRFVKILTEIHAIITETKKYSSDDSCILKDSVPMKRVAVHFAELGRLELEMAEDEMANRQYVEIVRSILDSKYEDVPENITRFGRILEEHNLLTPYTLVQMWMNGSIEAQPVLNTHSFIKHVKLVPPSQSPFDAFMKAALENHNDRKKIDYEFCRIISENLEKNKTYVVGELGHDFLRLSESTFRDASFNAFKESFGGFYKKSLFFLELMNKKIHNISEVYASIQVL